MLVVDVLKDEGLGIDEGFRESDRRVLSGEGERCLPAVEPQAFTVGEHHDVGVGAQDPVADLALQAGHHADHDDECHDTHADAADGDDRDQVEEARSAARRQVP